MLDNAYGKSTMKKSAVYDWYRRFQNGRTDPRDDQRSGRPTSTRHVNVAVIKNLLNKGD